MTDEKSIFRCPVCLVSLHGSVSSLSCHKGHSYDIAREGYVNLLLANQKGSKEPGDSPEMLRARRNFLNSGYYRRLAENVSERIIKYLDETGNLIASVNDLPLDAAIAMYPNPTSGELNISFNNIAAGNYNVSVYNTIGSLVLNQNMNVNGAVIRTINLNDLPNGIYMVQVSNENGSTTKKVIKN